MLLVLCVDFVLLRTYKHVENEIVAIFQDMVKKFDATTYVRYVKSDLDLFENV